MRQLFNILCFLFVKKNLFSLSQIIPNGKECSIYQIEKGQQVVFPNVNGSRFNFGYLRVNKDTPPTESQVFIDFLTKDKKEVKKMEIYLNSKGQIIVRYDGIKMAESTENLKNLSKLPSWYFFEVILQDGEIKIKRPGDATNIIKGKLPDVVTDNFEVSISSKCMEYVTFNCLTQCKTFDHLKGKTMIIKLQNSFTINLLCSKYKSTCFIKYAISSSWFQSFNHTNNLSPGMEIALQFKISVEDGVKKLHIILPGIDKKFSSETNGTINYILKIFEAQNLLWSFDCKPGKNPSLLSGRSLSLPQPHAKQGKNHMTFRLGEVAAWIVASLSLCGLLIVGLTLCMKVAQTEWPQNDEKFIHGASVSHVQAVEMMPYPKSKKSTFYAEIRKPEETSSASNDRRSINVISDFLYPMDLDLSIDDEIDSDERLNSKDTVLTQITNSNR